MKKITNKIIILAIITIIIGTFLPSIRIANENINILKEDGPILIVLAAIMLILIKLEKQNYIIIPTIVSIYKIIDFTIQNKKRLEDINSIYNCYAGYQYGLLVLLISNLIILTIITINIVNNTIKIKSIKPVKNKVKIQKTIDQTVKEEQAKKQKLITKETTKDGQIQYNKITVKCNNQETKNSFKTKIKDTILKLKLRKISKNKLTISKFNNTYKNINKTTNPKTYKVSVIDIKKWTRSEICCINCGATISTNSEYCFLCDCKMKLNEKKQKLS